MLRLVVILFFLFVSLLAVFRAPTNALWYGAILVAEFPYIFLIIEALLFIWGYRELRYVALGNGLIFLSVLIFLSPVARAWNVGRTLEAKVHAAFPAGGRSGDAPFSIFRMLPLLFAKAVRYRTMVYTSPGVAPLTLDFYPAQARGIRPCVVVVHGGSWAGGDSRQLPALNSHLARKGYHVASINYRLAPAYRSPAQVADLVTAVRFLHRNSTALSIDAANLVLLGRSAGGQVVLAAAYGSQNLHLRGVISFYGPADMEWGAQNPANPWVFNSGKVLEDYIGGSYASLRAQYAASSPVNFVTPASPPTLLIHGQNDVLVSYAHSTRLAGKLREHGVPHFLLTLPWATHGFDYNLNGPGGQLSTYCVEKFLASVTRR